MKHTKEEIVNALKVIKEECEANTTCATCPFRDPDEHRCRIEDGVETWELNSPRPELWRAFKS